MSLRQASERLLATTLENPKLFGFPLIIERTDTGMRVGDNPPLYGQVGEIGAEVDPETGAIVATEHSHATVRTSTLVSRGFITPEEIKHNGIMQGWIVRFSNIGGKPAMYRIDRAMADHTLGTISFNLGLVKHKYAE